MNNAQAGILADVPVAARYLLFRQRSGVNPAAALQALAAEVDGKACVVGLGNSLVLALGAKVDALHEFPSYSTAALAVPATPTALWLWLRGDDHGELLQRGRGLVRLLASAFTLEQAIDGYRYDIGRDLSGYEDGTENPTGDDAIATALVGDADASPGMQGSSFVAVQQWLHDFEQLEAMPPGQRDHSIGRRISDNEEIADAPASAHVKRTAQEDFDPEAFVLRRSMPWTQGNDAGLVFVAFGCSFDSFEALLRRMVGAEDGIRDALFDFTRPLSGSYFWCPPVLPDGGLDLSAIAL